MDANILAARVRECLHYDPETGHFTRRIRLAQRHQVGDRADFVVKSGGLAGYYRIGFDSKRYLAHRVAWLYVYGEWPKTELDHINGNPSDNRIQNLRECVGSVNRENIRKPRRNNQVGFLGVLLHQPGKYRARIQVHGKGIHLGLFDTPEKAHEAYVQAKRKLHTGCTI